MNALTSIFSTYIPRPKRPATLSSSRLVRRERDFGVGYGSSSGYAAAAARYVPERSAPRFRVG